MKPLVILELEEAKVLIELFNEKCKPLLEENKDIKDIIDKMDNQYKLGKGQIIKRKD